MSANTIAALDFYRFSRMYHLSAGGNGEIAVLSLEGTIIWAESPEGKEEIVGLKNNAFKSFIASGVNVYDSDNGKRIYEKVIESESQGQLATLCIYFKSGEIDIDPIHMQRVCNNLEMLSDSIVVEYELSKEIDEMADELASRYEELNLVYQTEGKLDHFSEWREALQHLVENSVEFMDVSMAALILDDKHTTLHSMNYKYPIANGYRTIADLRSSSVAWMKKENRSIVLNKPADKNRDLCCPDVPYKMVMSPVINTRQEVIGLLVMVNHYNRRDFSNSDRNLLDVMARMAGKVILANHDDLTGILNRQGFQYYLERALESAYLESKVHCMINIGIDQLKIINETASHKAGDLLIKRVVSILKEQIRSSDTISRLSGDEFILLLTNCAIDKGEQIAEKILEDIKKIDFNWEGKVFNISAGIGVTSISNKSANSESILTAAEIAKEVAKESGSNRVRVFTTGNQDLINRENQMQWVSKIQAALAENRFLLYAQKIAPISDDAETLHYEILLRLRSEDGEILSPFAFMPAAEKYNLMPAIDRWVVKSTFEALYNNLKQVNELGIIWGINLSGQSMNDDTFLDYICQQYKKFDISPEIICFEVTETTAINNIESARLFVNNLKEKGFQFALDDFGTGLSSFTYLQKLNVDYLKIDGSFVKNILTDPVLEAIVVSTNHVGHAMGLKTIAEFVENQEILQKLKELGVDYAQGYGLGKPRPIAEIFKLEGIVEVA